MKITIVGGSGHVGRRTLPYLAQNHELCVLDLAPPEGDCRFVKGSVNDPDAVREAVTGADAVIYMAMGSFHRDDPERMIDSQFDVNAKGVYRVLRAAAQAGVKRGLYTSTQSIYDCSNGRFFEHEEEGGFSPDLYGLTKRLGEEATRAVTKAFGMPIIVFRLTLPVSDEEYITRCLEGKGWIQTAASDLADAFERALQSDLPGWEAFFISGDYKRIQMSLDKAKRVLGWEPKLRCPEPAAAASS